MATLAEKEDALKKAFHSRLINFLNIGLVIYRISNKMQWKVTIFIQKLQTGIPGRSPLGAAVLCRV